MTVFRQAAFARLSPKIERAQVELREVLAFADEHGDEFERGQWGAVAAISLGIHNIYNGIEDILLSLARDIDDAVPVGPTMHQDILDQMVTEISGIRPPVLDQQLYGALGELKAFRHLVRHRYGFDLKADKVRENLDLVKVALPAVIDAVLRLQHRLADTAATHQGDVKPGQ